MIGTTAQHGTANRYVNYGCRCRPCTAAQREYQRKIRRRNAKRPADEVPHGINGYENYSCRCDVCKEANYRKAAGWYLRKADELAAQIAVPPTPARDFGSGAVDELDPGPQTGGSGSVRDRSSPRAAGHPD